MKNILVLGIFVGSSLFAASHVGQDHSGNFRCKCNDTVCESNDEVEIRYNQDTQYVSIEGRKWEYSGYLSRFRSKATGDVFLTFPDNSVGAVPHGATLVVRENGAVDFNSARLSCERVKTK